MGFGECSRTLQTLLQVSIMSLAQQNQIDLLKKRVSQLDRQVSQLDGQVTEANRKLDLLLNNFETTMAKAIDKVIADGIEVEQTTDSQIKALINE